MIDPLLDNILSNTLTQSQLMRKLKVLNIYLQSKLFVIDGSINSLSSEETNWLSSLDQNLLNQINKDNFHDFFSKLEQQARTISPLILYLAFQPPDEEVIKLGERLRKDYGKNFLFEIKVDPSLLAGCALAWRGVYKDYSLKSKIAANKEQLTSIFNQLKY